MEQHAKVESELFPATKRAGEAKPTTLAFGSMLRLGNVPKSSALPSADLPQSATALPVRRRLSRRALADSFFRIEARQIQVLAVVALASLASGCTELRYLTQASAGQADLMDRQVEIDRIVKEGHFSRRTRGLLAEVAPIKAFGERHGLRATASYRTFVNLERRAVVWVVSACDPLSFRSKTWSFPVTGSITYLGWFHHDDARAFGDDLRRHGWDVDVRPSSAYSTLGFFDDPVLSTMFVEGEGALGELADTILHESLHATYFVPGQSTLNESVASFVGGKLAVTYLDETRGKASKAKAAYVDIEDWMEARGARMKTAYAALAALYAKDLPPAEKKSQKTRILEDLRAATHAKGDLNNATLVQYKTYGSGQEELLRLYASCGESWPRFLRTLEGWRPLFSKATPHEDPAKLLQPLLARGCAQ